jgi:hypothetical protein
MMSRQLIIKIGPNETMRFPNLCTNCANPATKSRQLSQREGHLRRQVEVPLCAQCARQLAKKSAAEERLRKQSWLFAVVVAVVVFLAALFIFPGFWLRLLLAILLALLAGAIVMRLFRPAIARAALPQKKAVLESAQLESFNWRSATFKFDNETFIERFIELNEPLILEMSIS